MFAIAMSGSDAFALGDPAHGPCILNGYRLPISFVATFSDGRSSAGTLPTGTDAWQRLKGRRLRSLVVTTTDGARRVYTAARLDDVRQAHSVADELWVVGESGIRLDDLRRIEAVRKELSVAPK
jgi:hypothetical protein